MTRSREEIENISSRSRRKGKLHIKELVKEILGRMHKCTVLWLGMAEVCMAIFAFDVRIDARDEEAITIQIAPHHRWVDIPAFCWSFWSDWSDWGSVLLISRTLKTWMVRVSQEEGNEKIVRRRSKWRIYSWVQEIFYHFHRIYAGRCEL